MTNTTEDAELSAAGIALRQRIDEPEVAASLMILLDNADLLSTLVLGLAGVMQRGDMIMDAVAESVADIKSVTAANGTGAGIGDVVSSLSAAAPALQQLANSSVVRPETIAFLDRLSTAATEGAANAARHSDPPSRMGLVKELKDRDVRKGLDVLIEIARSLGKNS